uniref:Reverse transcriptase domain-containing protein n=1 Tax=Pygocentrus nattereri TaxID=42514 RepID=A0AAR2IKG0_PYGNA
MNQIYSLFSSASQSFSFTDSPSLNTKLTCFKCVDSFSVSELITKSNASSYQFDPAPTPLLKACPSVINTPVTTVINSCISSGSVPAALKTAAVTQILKKPELDPTSLSNYRPISHLPFLPKVMERLVASQLQTFLSDNAVYEPFQSGFRTHHSTEAALLRVVHDLLRSADSGSLNIVLLLDLSAAFDTVNHDVLISRLFSIGITDTALYSWTPTFLNLYFTPWADHS